MAIAAELRDAGVPDTAIDSGWEYNMLVELKYAGYINDSEIENPAGAYVPHPSAPCRRLHDLLVRQNSPYQSCLRNLLRPQRAPWPGTLRSSPLLPLARAHAWRPLRRTVHCLVAAVSSGRHGCAAVDD